MTGYLFARETFILSIRIISNKKRKRTIGVHNFIRRLPRKTNRKQFVNTLNDNKMTGITSTVSNQHKSIEKAAKVPNPLEPFADEFSKYTNGDFETSIYCKWKANMDAKTLKWAFKLAERNVSPFYRTGPIGWQPKVKQSDLNKNWARYLVAIDKQKNPIAYAMFRFDMDYGTSVLYW